MMHSFRLVTSFVSMLYKINEGNKTTFLLVFTFYYMTAEYKCIEIADTQWLMNIERK